ncbi:hypothetical protein [Microbulbifer epialgicus]|uniref:Uncharacterized protein n=1 Tax=Microbulbifer epialgicus TaxID=393907 RepID=A0ABV4P7V4_9GAMM
MKIFKKILIGIGVVLLIPIGVVVWFFSSGGIFGECETQELVRSKSPGDKYEAMVYTKGCGATTPTATIVALRQDRNASAFEGHLYKFGDKFTNYWSAILWLSFSCKTELIR